MKFKQLISASAAFFCASTLSAASSVASAEGAPGEYWSCLRSSYDQSSAQTKDLSVIQDAAIDACQPLLRKHLEAVYLADLKRSGDTGTPADPAGSTKAAEEAEIEHARALIKTWHSGN
ncbi:hypothetical protein ACM7HD_10610 [Pseudomonas aeruginosa]